MDKVSYRDNYRLKVMAESCHDASTILDVGTFYSNPYLVKQKKRTNGLLIGLDIEKRKKPIGYDRMIKGDVHFLEKSFPKNYFDAIVMGEVIEHLGNPYQALASCKKVLKPDGILIISTPNPLGFPRIFFEFSQNKKYFYGENHLFMFIPRWIERIFQLTGFQIVKKSGLAWIVPVKLFTSIADEIVYVLRKRKKEKT